jgi:Cytochrome c7 and related cytochrome c
MPQIFHPSTNTISRVSIFGAVISAFVLFGLLEGLQRSDWVSRANVTRQQPLEFSHKHHVGDDGIDCRYCHTSVETSAFAGIPPTKTCMNCHSMLFTNVPYLAPVRDSFRTGNPIEWTRVDKLPDFVYFNHSIHISKGIGCSTCHGRVDQMPLVRQVASLQMHWCLDCHRHPENYVRPRSEVFNMAWEPPADQMQHGLLLVKEYKIRSVRDLTSCSTCHR